jgi:ATP-dependent Lhr-like helicase
MSTTDPLSLFVPPAGEWFRAALGEPTAPQREGWPAIASGQHTLILAPTGSGKTLAAFLACLDTLWRQTQLSRGVQVLYVSPLKALNNDIHRNLQAPLEGVAATARRMNYPLPHLEAAVRTGDTPTAERQRLARKPPHILITTPESLHLILTSRSREILRGVTHCIIDEIHALCTNKRGVFLALLLERLEALNARSFVRIGLSATQRPLEEVARYLGGSAFDAGGNLVPRPVTIVDAGVRKDLDLRVVSPVEHFGPLPEKSIWPSIYRLLDEQIREHRSTLVFANDRRAVERITSCLNEGEEVLAHAHHGSVALEVRQQTEQALKEGRLPCVVATASLEMGIDMGAVDLVCQVASPGNVARGLQRVGRAGHLVGQKSKGRLIPRTCADLLEQAVLAREMVAGRVEAIRVPTNCLDVLAQQLVALAAMDTWNVPDLYTLVRRSYPYRDLTPEAFETVLEMISGRYRFTLEAAPTGEEAGNGPVMHRQVKNSMEALHPRVSWDRVHNRLLALPGSQNVALVQGGTIPDTGQYAAYTTSGVRIGELDEEFIYERRLGDAFLLGTNSWRVERIDADRVIVSPAEGALAVVPFWRGEGLGRSADLGEAIGRFLRELQEKLDAPDCLDWLQRDHCLDAASARNLCLHVQRQLASNEALPTDQTLIIEVSRDQLGDWQVVVLSPRGSRLHLALRLALEGRLKQRLGYRPQCLHHDDGVLMRQADTDQPILDLFDGLTPENVETFILDELADSALFALRFRQNAARALLLPRGKPGQRAPLWLQRLRGRDLLQVARRHPDFPVVVETFRECLHDHLDVPRLQKLLEDIRSGAVRVVTQRRETPSAFASGLLFSFQAANMYRYDDVEGDSRTTPGLDQQLLQQLLTPEKQGHLLDPRAVNQVEGRLRGVGQPPRTPTEMAEWLRRLGDLGASELTGPMAAFLEILETEGRVCRLTLPAPREPERWVLIEERERYEQAFALVEATPSDQQASGAAILERFLNTHALVGLDDVLARYPFERAWAERLLREWAERGRVVAVRAAGAATLEAGAPQVWATPGNLDQVQRSSLGLLRKEVLTCSPAQFADFLLRWQFAHPATRKGAAEGLAEVLQRLEGMPLPVEVWEQTVLPARVAGYQRRWLDEWVSRGAGVWVTRGDPDSAGATLAFLNRENLDSLRYPSTQIALDPESERVLDCLRRRGACFVTDIAQDTGLAPSSVRNALWTLLSQSLVSNDQFEVLRRGKEAITPAVPTPEAARRGETRLSLSTLRRRGLQQPEGRWSLVTWGQPEPEAQAIFAAWLLLQRYGIAARELALQDSWMPPWRVLYEVLARLELAGEVRRGYFVEGLSGAQYALPEAASQLQDLHLPSTANAPVLLLHSQDPANVYGSGAPFDVLHLDGDARPFLRRAGNWLVLRAGQPVLLIEQQGRKLTALATASRDDVLEAVKCLPNLCDPRNTATRHKLTVDEWNGQPVTSTEGRELLEAVGFVRDYQGMTLYAAWR